MSDTLIQHAIARLVPEGSRVLDLGCGDGSLLDHLQRERGPVALDDFTIRNLTEVMQAQEAASRAMTGCICRHGPHQSALKSTSTACGLDRTSC